MAENQVEFKGGPTNGPPFQDLIELFILPMFPGTVIHGTDTTLNKHLRASLLAGGCDIAVSPGIKPGPRLVLRRSQPFQNSDLAIIRNFLRLYSQIPANTPEPLVNDLLHHSLRRTIATSTDSELSEILVNIFDQYSSWAEQTYEGNRIACGIGITDEITAGGVPLHRVFMDDFAKVLSNGVDTLLICSQEGQVVDHAVLKLKEKSELAFSPFRFVRIAQWASGEKLAIVLNRNGDILVFKGGLLRFAKRRGVWRHFTHHQVVSLLLKGGAGTPAVRSAVYRTALDVSFARTGGCFAIVRDASVNKVKTMMKSADTVSIGTSTKARCLRMIASKTFQSLPRALRQELTGIDGAMVLDRKGRIIDIGSIVQIDGGSTGGGRLAAAKQLSHHGVAIKVSADGEMQGFVDGIKIFNTG